MASLTKKAIRDSFLRLLDERPFSKITVKDIVDGCGINRNSFYYHFQDIPALMEDIIREETDRIITAYPSIDSIEDCLDVALEFVLNHRRAVLHIYHSVSRDVYERHLWTVCDHTVRRYFDAAFPDRSLSERDREIVIRHLKCECFGEVSEWLENGMNADIRGDFRRLCELKKGQVEEMLRRCEAEDVSQS